MISPARPEAPADRRPVSATSGPTPVPVSKPRYVRRRVTKTIWNSDVPTTTLVGTFSR